MLKNFCLFYTFNQELWHKNLNYFYQNFNLFTLVKYELEKLVLKINGNKKHVRIVYLQNYFREKNYKRPWPLNKMLNRFKWQNNMRNVTNHWKCYLISIYAEFTQNSIFILMFVNWRFLKRILIIKEKFNMR